MGHRHGGESRDWSDAATSQGMPGATRSWNCRGRALSRAFRGREDLPANTLISDFWLQTVSVYISVVLSVQDCGDFLQQL